MEDLFTQYCGQQLLALLDVTCCVRLQTLLHVVVCCWELLRKVLKLVKPLATCKRTQQLPIWLGQQRWDRFAVALNHTTVTV